MKEAITFSIDGQIVSADVNPGARLSDVLRDKFGLMGLYSSCKAGYCGACSVQIDGRMQATCMMMAVQAHGMEIITKIHPDEQDEDD